MAANCTSTCDLQSRGPHWLSNAKCARKRTLHRRGPRSQTVPFFLRRPTFPRFSIPAFSTMIALAMVAVLLFVETRQTTLGAIELLNRAEKWQENITTERAPVLHRRFSLTKRRRGAEPQRTFVDVWRRAGANVKLSRWTDATGQLLAEVKLAPSALPSLAVETIWEFEPSADAFVAAAGPIDRATVSNTAVQSTIHASSAELVLDRATNRPVEEKLSLDTSDYVFNESSTETISLAASPFSRSFADKVEKSKHLRISSQPLPDEIAHANLDSKLDERELRVRRELHVLGLAATATVQRQGDTIDVQLARTRTDQIQQLQAAVEEIPNAQISLLDPHAAVRAAAPMQNSSAPVALGERLKEPLASKWLKASMNSEAEVHAEEERRVEIARRLVELVAEWRLLAERYPVITEAQLNVDARPILNEIVDDLRARIIQDVTAERTAVGKLLASAADLPNQNDSERTCEPWQSQAIRAADSLWENDQLVEQFYAPTSEITQTASGTSGPTKLRHLLSAIESVLNRSCTN